MTIDINYGKYTLFDIEYWQNLDETKKSNEKRWFSEIDVCVCVRGVTKFLMDKFLDENFNPDEFIKDSENIQELRRWLWETHDNSLCDSDTGSNRHYHIFKPELDNIIKTYCEKYGFDINID